MLLDMAERDIEVAAAFLKAVSSLSIEISSGELTRKVMLRWLMTTIDEY